ncbi:MAG TPA: transporter substrate-binding domain-containing protein [Micromonosporaceae bacterium]|nr:transporter substrate-binding domain-containing protein [Micromonosporaceae bacterium]
MVAFSQKKLIAAGAVLVLLILVGAAAWRGETEGPKLPSVAEKLAEAGLDDHARHPVLRIGIHTERRLLGFGENGTYTGFDIEVARFIARNLGYGDKIQWVPIRNANDRIVLLEQDAVDLVLASFSITDERKKRVRFAGPYLITEQSVLVPTRMSRPISSIQDLRNLARKVCVAASTTSESLLVDRKLEFDTRNNSEVCFRGILDGDYEAMVAGRTILVGFADQAPGKVEVLDLELGLEDNLGIDRVGIGVSKNNPALQDLVNYFLNKSYLDQQAGRMTEWQRAYDLYLAVPHGQQSQPKPDETPQLLDYDAKAPMR